MKNAKSIKFVIVNDNRHGDRLYLISWNANVTMDSPYGLTWTSYDRFISCNGWIKNFPDQNFGDFTIFKTRQDAINFAGKYLSNPNWKVIEVLM